MKKYAKIFVGLFICLGFLHFLLPPDLQKFKDQSRLLLDMNKIPISAQQSIDEKWRFLTMPEDVPELYLKMLLKFEDKRFYYHFGVDPIALARAMLQWLKNGKIISGGSTITMQVVRLLSPKKRTILSKIIEAVRAVQLELMFSKKDILTMYLTLTPQGNNFEGIFAAAYGYFLKHPKDLSYSQMALLVAIPQSPTKLRPNVHCESAKAARDKVLNRCLGLISQQDIDDAKQDAISPIKNPFPKDAPHLLQRLKSSTIIHSTIDGQLQREVQKTITSTLTNFDAEKTIAILVIENKTQKVRCYIGSYDYFDKKRQGYVDMIKAIRSPGSALKPFIYAQGFDDNMIDANTIVDDTKTNFSDYCPTNFKDVFHGETTIKDALQQSLNIPAVMLLEKIGPKRFLTQLCNLKVTLKLPEENIASLPIALGGIGISLFDLASLYTALANNGCYKPLKLIEDDVTTDDSSKLCSIETAKKIKKILQDAPPPDGYVTWHAVESFPIAFKTGTSYGCRDALCIGYTNDYTVAVWMGRADGSPLHQNIGRLNAAPLVFSIFHSNLPKCAEEDTMHENKPLPFHLKKVTTQKAKTLKITAPSDGAKILKTNKNIYLKAENNTGKVTWVVNNKPIES